MSAAREVVDVEYVNGWPCKWCSADIALALQKPRETMCWARGVDMRKRGLPTESQRPAFCSRRCRREWARGWTGTR